MQSTQVTPRLPRTSVRQNNHANKGGSRIPHQVQVQALQQQQQQQASPPIYCNGTQPPQTQSGGANQIVISPQLSSPTMQNVQPYLGQKSATKLATNNAEGSNLVENHLQSLVNDEERRKRYLTFSKDQVSSHVKSLKEELFSQQVQDQQQQQQQQQQLNNKAKYHSSSSATAKAIEQRLKKLPCGDGQQQKHDSYFVSMRSQASGQEEARIFTDASSDKCQVAIEDKLISPNSSVVVATSKTTATTNRPRPLERLSKLPQQQPSLGRVFPSPRNSVQHEFKNLSQELGPCGDEQAFKKSSSAVISTNNNNNYNNNSSFRHQPVCEAFIMTGQSMMKLSSNECDNQNNSSVARSNNVTNTMNDHQRLAHDQKAKSVSLNKLNVDNGQKGGRSFSVDSSELLEEGDPMRPPVAEITQDNIEDLKRMHDEQSDIYLKRRAFIAGIGSSESSIDCQQSQPHELASLLQNQHQQQQQQQNQYQSQRQLGQQQQQGAQQHSSNSGDFQQHALVENVARENNGLAPGRGQLHYPQQQQQQQQLNLDSRRNVTDNKIGQVEKLNLQFHYSSKDGQMEYNTDGQAESQVAMSASNQQTSTNAGEQIDRESARRLAKRLYNLSGFKRSDVCHHLAKNNPFSQIVAEEYLKLFDFRSMKLDAALRKFLSKLQLNGETQERERILSQFSQRYYECSKEKFPSADVVQTLVCAIILLNTDLHANHLDRKASKKGGSNKRARLGLGAWIDGLNSSLKAQCGNGQSANLVGQFTASSPNNISASFPMDINNTSAPSNYCFPRHLLVDLYESIKKRPLKCGDDKCDMTSFEVELEKIYSQQFGNANNRSNTLPTRRFAPGSNAPSSTLSATSRRQLKQGLNRLDGANDGLDDGDFSIEFKSGILFRKRILDAQGKPTTKGRRSWRRVYVILQDLRLIMRYNYDPPAQHDNKGNNSNDDKSGNTKKQPTFSKQKEKQLVAQDMKNTLKLHHSSAGRSTTYTKREYVFHLRLADQSELLLQATSEADMNTWIDTINFASACLSSPALPSAVSNSKRYQLRQQRPILPTSYTRLSYWEQLIDHEERLQGFKLELEEHICRAPQTKNADKRAKSEFIERIAHLKQEIERYNVYVELMRKKSNSPEAIILSKHPQIASLTPSEEMIKSLPSFAPPQKLDENPTDDEDSQSKLNLYTSDPTRTNIRSLRE